MRGFMVCKGFENSEVNLPKRGTKFSAGYDIESIESLTIKPGEVSIVKTGLKSFMGDDEVLKLFVRSSIGIKKNLMLANTVGIIDKDYFENENNDGHIQVALYNFGSKEVSIDKGERIAQGIFEKYLTITNEEDITQVRAGGIGSTNK